MAEIDCKEYGKVHCMTNTKVGVACGFLGSSVHFWSVTVIHFGGKK